MNKIPRKPHKYKAKKTKLDGYTFASVAEARRFTELKLLQRTGRIENLTLQPRFKLIVKTVPICTYVADFQYWDNDLDGWVIEDVKGFPTPVFKLKEKLFRALYPEKDLRIVI